MGNSLSDKLFGFLGMLILRYTENDGFQVIGTPPGWVESFRDPLSGRWEVSQFLDRSHFLQDYFLPRAKKVWDKESGQEKFRQWEERTLSDEKYDLKVMALAIGTYKLLVIKKSDPQIRARLQKAREKSQ